MFETFPVAPPDPILGLGEAFRQESRPEKINLSVGVYQDAKGQTPILDCVRQAERRLLEEERDKSYLGIAGMPQYGAAVQELLFSEVRQVLDQQRAATLQTPGGTGALRLAADLIKRQLPRAKVWVSKPTWPNHPSVFQAAGVQVEQYPYFDAQVNGIDFNAMLSVMRTMPEGDIPLLHACCHNPTGADPTLDQWRQIGEVVRERKLLPLIDFAYQGFGNGLVEDARGTAELARQGCELLVCSSFSKNFGLYGERVGALSIVSTSAAGTEAALSQAKACARANWSNPPKHGAALVAEVLSDRELRSQWEREVAQMRDRIHEMRRLLVEGLAKAGVQRDFSFLTRQKGMFSFTGLTPMQVDELRTKYAIYVVGSGRINVAGITRGNVEAICRAIAAVL